MQPKIYSTRCWVRPRSRCVRRRKRDCAAWRKAIAEDEGKQRVGVETVIIAWVRSTPEALKPDLPRLMEKFGLDADEYRHLLE